MKGMTFAALRAGGLQPLDYVQPTKTSRFGCSRFRRMALPTTSIHKKPRASA